MCCLPCFSERVSRLPSRLCVNTLCHIVASYLLAVLWCCEASQRSATFLGCLHQPGMGLGRPKVNVRIHYLQVHHQQFAQSSPRCVALDSGNESILNYILYPPAPWPTAHAHSTKGWNLYRYITAYKSSII